jgi:hypothetical protein
MMERPCIKNTELNYYCGCPDCQKELAEKSATHNAEVNARRAKIAASVTNYWQTDLSSGERDQAVSQFMAGHDEPLVRCQHCKEKYDRRTGAYHPGWYSLCSKCC